MDPLQRLEPIEKCTNEACYYANDDDSLQFMQNHELELKNSAEALKNCIKRLLNQDETSDLAHKLIGSSLTFVDPESERESEAEGARVQEYQFDDASWTLLDPASLDGFNPYRIGLNTSSARLDLVKLSAQLPAKESDVGLEALGEQWQIFLRFLYGTTAIISILLNVITVIVLYRAKPSELRKYLINLAIGDLLMSCFSMPFTYSEFMLGYWNYPPVLCPVVKFVVTLTVYVSVCTLVVIGVNRHLAILDPMKELSERASKCSNSTVICGIWLSGAIISSPEFLMFKSTQFCYNQKYLHICQNMWSETYYYYYSVFIYLTTFVIPFMLLCYFYSRIGIQLKHHEVPGNADASRDLSLQMKRARVIKMLIVVVVVFTIFWLPLQTFTLITLVWPSVREVNGYHSTAYNIFVGTYFSFHWMSMAHSCLNPLIYCFMNPKFRKDLSELICGLQLIGAGARGPLFGGRNRLDSHPKAATKRAHHCSLHQLRQQQQLSTRVQLKMGKLGGGDVKASNKTEDETQDNRGGCKSGTAPLGAGTLAQQSEPARNNHWNSENRGSFKTKQNYNENSRAGGSGTNNNNNNHHHRMPNGLADGPLIQMVVLKSNSRAQLGPPSKEADERCETLGPLNGQFNKREKFSLYKLQDKLASELIEIETVPEVSEEEEEGGEKIEEKLENGEGGAEGGAPVEPTQLVIEHRPGGDGSVTMDQQRHQASDRGHKSSDASGETGKLVPLHSNNWSQRAEMLCATLSSASSDLITSSNGAHIAHV